MAISGPKRSGDYPDRLVGCEQAIEAELQALIARAMDAGWDEMEACSPLSSGIFSQVEDALMCGRFTQMMSWRELVALYRLTDKFLIRNTEARFNIAPTQTVPFIRMDDEGNQVVDDGRWWLVPHWAKEMPKAAMFNARIETVDTGPAFRDAFKTRRCLIPADGFYEWTKADDGGKDPWLIQMPGEMPFAFAGLWAHNSKLDVTSCTIITAPSIAPISQIHDRMPVILDPEVFEGWLNPSTPKENLKGILAHHLDGQMQMHRVSRDINSSRFTGRPAPIINSL